MTAGRELDAAIATKLFKLPVGQECSEKNVDYEGSFYDTTGYHCNVCAWHVDELDEGFYKGHFQSEPHVFTAARYSADIAEAWKIVEKLAESKASCFVKCYGSLYPDVEEGCEYSCQIYTSDYRLHESAATAAEAICKAAIRWIEDCTDA